MGLYGLLLVQLELTIILPHMEHTYGPLRPATGAALADHYSTSQESHPWVSTTCYLDRFASLYVDVRT
jgi:hypothetical protein